MHCQSGVPEKPITFEDGIEANNYITSLRRIHAAQHLIRQAGYAAVDMWVNEMLAEGTLWVDEDHGDQTAG